MAYETNHLSGYEKDQIRKKVGHNRLTGSEMDSGRNSKKGRLATNKNEAKSKALKHKLN